MKRLIIILLIIMMCFCAYTGCSTVYLKQSFTDFSKSTGSIGKNTGYCFEQLFAEEINTHIAESSTKESLTPKELEPHTLTRSQLELRIKLLDYLANYVKLLESVVIIDYQKDITKNSKQIRDDLTAISANHDFIDKKEIALLTSLSTGLSEALTSSARRAFLIKIMSKHQPLLEQTAAKLVEELLTTRLMINNFFQRQFLYQVSLPWPAKDTQREKYAKIGAKILDRQRKINSMLDQVITALDLIPMTHLELMRLLKNNDSPVTTLSQLTDYGARLEEMYMSIAGKKK